MAEPYFVRGKNFNINGFTSTYQLYSSTDNLLSPIPIPVSDWLIFCCGNLMLHQKKKMKMMKTQIF